MNLIGQWNKDKTQCWVITTDESDKYRAELVTIGQHLHSMQTIPWRDTMEEAQKDIPHENT